MVISLSLLSFPSLLIYNTFLYNVIFSFLTPSHSVPRPSFLSLHLLHPHVPQFNLLVHSLTLPLTAPSYLQPSSLAVFLCSSFLLCLSAHSPTSSLILPFTCLLLQTNLMLFRENINETDAILTQRVRITLLNQINQRRKIPASKPSVVQPSDRFECESSRWQTGGPSLPSRFKMHNSK